MQISSALQRLLLRVRPAFLAAGIKKLLRIERLVVDTRHGRFLLDPVSNLGSRLMRTGEYEPEMARTLEHYLAASSTFLDVGANEGYFSVMGSKLVGPAGRVIAIEPQTRLQAVLKENLRLNDALRVEVVTAAISDTSGKAKLHISPDTNTGSSSLAQTTAYRLPTEEVPTKTLLDLLAECRVGTVDLMKMDIEGFEYEAILGSKALFASHRIRALALELHPAVLAKKRLNPDDITNFLRESGYRRENRFSNDVWVAP
ncbi:MAG TPA: FkbM family methyltransferase [Usitatibacter sp.]